MIKKTLITFTVFLSFGIVYLFFSHPSQDSLSSENCAFCDPTVLANQTFYEDDLVLALYTHKPIFPGHSLIIPKRHVERFDMLTDLEIMRMGQVIKKVNQAARKVFETSAYILIQKNGREVGQSVPHVHFHYIPRKRGDDSSLKFIFRMYLVNLQNPISPSEMQEAVQKMREAMKTSDDEETEK